MTGKNRIIICGPKDDGTYVVEFRTASGERLGSPYRSRRSKDWLKLRTRMRPL
jgi:hypothetical protein